MSDPSSTSPSSRRAGEPAPADRSFERAATALEVVCLGFASLGLVLPLAYATPMFALYREAVAAAVSDPALPASSPTLTLVLGITGGSIAGKWVAHWAVVRFGVRHRQRWARDATLAGLLSWLALDSASSLWAGAWANVVFVNVMPPLLLGPLLWRVWSSCDRPPDPADARHRSPARLALATAVIGCGTGLVIALGMDTPLFDVWRAGLADAHFGGAPISASTRALVRFFAGPIGGATLGQFVLLAYIAKYALPAGAGWAWRASLGSLLVWALVDCGYGVVSGGAFNILLVNLPCLGLVAPPLLWAGSRAERGSRT